MSVWLFDLPDAIEELVREHGGIRSLAKHTGVDAGYLSCLRRGKKHNPSGACLKSLGLKSVVRYEKITRNKQRKNVLETFEVKQLGRKKST